MLISAENIFATNALVTVKLLGGASKTFEFSKTFAVGLKDMELKWNFHLVEKHTTPRMFCIFGALELPTEIQALRKVKFQNKIGFGATCEQHEITMNGFTVTSQRQIEFSRRSEAARECPRIAREATELDMHIRSLPEGAERAKMVSTYGHMVLKRESMCGLKKRQETALDQIEIEITATPNLPVEVYTVGRYLDSILKGLFIEYINQPNFRNRDMHGVKMVIEFDQRLEALNLMITSPLDTTVFKNIRLPFWLSRSTGHSLGNACMASASSTEATCTPLTRRPTTTTWTTTTTWWLLTAPRGTPMVWVGPTPSWPRRRTTSSTS